MSWNARFSQYYLKSSKYLGEKGSPVWGFILIPAPLSSPLSPLLSLLNMEKIGKSSAQFLSKAYLEVPRGVFSSRRKNRHSWQSSTCYLCFLDPEPDPSTSSLLFLSFDILEANSLSETFQAECNVFKHVFWKAFVSDTFSRQLL